MLIVKVLVYRLGSIVVVILKVSLARNVSTASLCRSNFNGAHLELAIHVDVDNLVASHVLSVASITLLNR